MLTLFAMAMVLVLREKQYVIVYMDILDMDARFLQLVHLILVMVTLFVMALVLVLREEQYVIVHMDILEMDVKFHQFQQQIIQQIIQVQSHHQVNQNYFCHSKSTESGLMNLNLETWLYPIRVPSLSWAHK